MAAGSATRTPPGPPAPSSWVILASATYNYQGLPFRYSQIRTQIGFNQLVDLHIPVYQWRSSPPSPSFLLFHCSHSSSCSPLFLFPSCELEHLVRNHLRRKLNGLEKPSPRQNFSYLGFFKIALTCGVITRKLPSPANNRSVYKEQESVVRKHGTGSRKLKDRDRKREELPEVRQGDRRTFATEDAARSRLLLLVSTGASSSCRV